MSVGTHVRGYTPSTRRLPAWVRHYGPSLLLAGAALVVTEALIPMLDGAFLVLSMSAVAVAALLGGFGPGVLATMATAVGFALLFIRRIQAHDAWQLGLFVGVGLLVAWLTGSPASAFRRSVLARREADERARQQACVAELGLRALEAPDVDALWELALEAMTSCLGVDLAAVLELLHDGETLLLRAGIGWREGLAGTFTVRPGAKSLARAALESGGAVVVADVPTGDADMQRLLREHGAVSGMSVVIGGPGEHGRPFGILAVHTRERRVFSRNDVSFLQGVANLVAAHVVRLRSAISLRSQLDFVRAITGALAEGVFAIDRQARITFVNAAAQRMLGYREEELVGRIMSDAIGCRRADGALCPLPCPVLNVMGTRRDCDTEQEFLTRRDGTTFPISCTASPIVNEGRTAGAVVAFQDVTERRRAEARERFLAQATEELSKSIDYEETLTRVARLALPNLGDWSLVVLVDERTGDPRRVAVEAVDPRLAPAARAMMDRYPIDLQAEHGAGRVLRTGQPELIPVVSDFVGSSGPTVAARLELLQSIGMRSFMAVPLRAHARVLGVLDFAVSTSDRRFGPEDLALAEELARRCAVAIENARLYREAQDALRAREETLAVVSHDLRNPLGAIQVTANVLARITPRGPEDTGLLRRCAESIQRVTRRMDRLIDDLVDLASIDAGRLSVDRRPHDASAVAGEAIDALSALAQERGVALRLETSAGSPLVLCDRDRVLQVLSNLIGNALKVTPPGGNVLLRVERREAEVVFTVRDTGPGFPEDELPRLFDRYWRGKGAKYKGTGLGLTIARALVEAQGGRIWAESRPGAGATFGFALAAAGEL